jgi:DNA uptake protein ComE-like DNA-binding protein
MGRSGLSLQQGFVLVVTLWFLVLASLVAGYSFLWLQQAVAETQREKQELDDLVDLIDTRNRLLYLFAVRRMTVAGLTVSPTEKKSGDDYWDSASISPTGDEIRLDARYYKGAGRSRFRVQDERGLLSLHGLPGNEFESFLQSYGMDGWDADRLIATLRDYVDPDDLIRLNGAEGPDYKKLEMALPPGRKLAVPGELARVVGWKEASQLWEKYVPDRFFSAFSMGLPNINTAPPEVLRVLAGFDEEAVDRILAARDVRPFESVSDLIEVLGAGVPYDETALFFFPLNYVRIGLSAPSLGEVETVMAVKLTPDSDGGAPWEIDYQFSIPVFPEASTADQIGVIPGVFDE